MHDVSTYIAGATLVALSTVMGLPGVDPSGLPTSEVSPENTIVGAKQRENPVTTGEERPLHIFHPARGWHHAWADRASGLCVCNDTAIAIAHVLRMSEAKVFYIDFGAHHADGVQRAFYDDPRVMTVSFHETGRFLFPETGGILDIGTGIGGGCSINIPLEPFTEDDSYLEVMNAILPPLATAFGPDVIFSQHECDTHAWDLLSRLHLTICVILAQSKAVHTLAHTLCGGRWVALGGGDNDPHRVIPRAHLLNH